MKKSICILLSMVMLAFCAVSFAGCNEDEKEIIVNKSLGVEAFADLGYDTEELGINPTMYQERSDGVGFQLFLPKNGDKIATVKTNVGTFKIRLFEEQAPNTVANFIALAEAGKYDGVIFHRVIKDFMVQTGDYENQDGTGGASAEGGTFEDEFCDRLLNLRGSVAMANSGADTNGSQFFINTCSTVDFDSLESQWEQFKTEIEKYKGTDSFASMMNYYITQGYTALYNTDSIDGSVRIYYEENGGNPYLDGAYNAGDRGHTVFGQVYEGMVVIDEIESVKTDSNDKPKKDIIIKSVKIGTYSGPEV